MTIINIEICNVLEQLYIFLLATDKILSSMFRGLYITLRLFSLL